MPSKKMTAHKNQTVQLKDVELHPTYLKINANTTIARWIEIGRELKVIGDSLQWWIGDWLNFGEARYGEKFSQALEETPYSYSYLQNLKYVAGKIEVSRRRDNLNWSAHAEVASLEPIDQDRVLDKAAGLPRAEIRSLIKELGIEKPEPEKPQKCCPECGALLPPHF